jgi:hypothetical protein
MCSAGTGNVEIPLPTVHNAAHATPVAKRRELRKMERGVLVMLDALGFKGIWKRSSPQDVVAKLEHLKSVVERTADFLGEPLGKMTPSVKVRFLSDTIVIGVSGHAEHDLSIAAHIAASAALDAVERPPVLAYRGAVAHGEYMISEQHFIVGPAVDDAAKHMDLAEGAFVWSLPSTNAAYPEATETAKRFALLQRFPVPLKSGAAYDTVSITPFVPIMTTERRREVADAILATFATDDVRIAVKQQNTKAFLDAARARLLELEKQQQI